MNFARISYKIPLVIVFICTIIWVSRLKDLYQEASEYAGRFESDGRRVVTLARYELYLKAVSVRRFAKRTGRMPGSLLESCVDGVEFNEWLTWCSGQGRHSCRDPVLREESSAWSDCIRRDPGDLHPGLFYVFRMGVPVNALIQSLDRSLGTLRQPPPGLDAYGLPVLFRVGNRPRDPAGIDSEDPLPPEVSGFFRAKGIELSASPQSFSLVSLRIRDRLDQQARLDRRLTQAWMLMAGGMALAVILTLAILYRWGTVRKKRPVKTLTLLMVIGVLASVATPVHHIDYSACYFHGISRADLLNLLDDAVWCEEIPPEVVQCSRQYLLSLPNDDESRVKPLRVRD